MSDSLVPLSSVLSIEKENEAERFYLIKVMTSSNDSSQSVDTVGVAFSGTDLAMTGILNGNEKYIRYYKGEIMTIYDNTIATSAWAPDNVLESPRFVQKLDAIRKFLTDNGKPL